MTRALKILAILAVLASLVVLVLLPPAAATTAPPPVATVRGAFHIHSDRSDGSGSLDDIAAAAARAGLQFIILTDHGDGTRPPEAPSYRRGVLTIDAVELNTTGGHFAVLGLPATPYPFAGTPADVIEDVRRLGGFGIAAHPGSPRASLSWKDWDAAFDGLEWINADSEWRDEPRIPMVRAFLTYFFRPPESIARLLDRPAAVLERWDAIALRRRVTALAGSDAHARLGLRQGGDPDRSSMHVRVPGYEASFRTFSNHVVLDGPLSGNAATDAARVTDAIRQGRVYTVVDGLATPGSLSFTASSGSQAGRMGDDIAVEGDVLLRASVSAPPGTTLVLLRNGQHVHEVTDGVLETNGGKEPAVYRVEAYTAEGPGGPQVPWILSNPIYAGITRVAEPPPLPAAAPVSRIPARSAEAGAEQGANDSSTIQPTLLTDPRDRRFAGDPAIGWSYALSPGIAAGQFAAVRIPISGGVAAFDRVVFRVSAPKPVRAWVQLRAPVANSERWGVTFYADAESRVIDLPLRGFAPIGVTSSAQPPLDRVDALLFVIDTLNSLPGTKGEMTISEVAFVK
jgi:hypothetical protein